MKKFICVLFCLLFAFGAYSCLLPELFVSAQEDESSALFAENIGQMLSDADGVSEYGANTSAETRLIVKTKAETETFDAVSVAEYGSLLVLQFDNLSSAQKAYDYYSSAREVQYVEYDKELSAADVDDDEEESSDGEHLSWGVESTGLDRLCNELVENNVALEKTVVAVIDSGVDYNHEFLKNRVEITRINTSSGGSRNDCMDTSGHGTQVAGVIADSTPESVVIKPYRVLDDYGNGTFISVAAGINCAVDDGVDVINLSLGFYEDSKVLREAITYALENDIVVVGAAGNDATDDPFYPASYPDVLKITAVNSQFYAANFTNFGDDVNFAAPGVKINTTKLGGGYTTVSGTSFAAPFASAEAAIIKAVMPSASFEDVFDIMKEYAVLDTYQSYNTDRYGWGLLNAPTYDPENIFEEKTKEPVFSLPNEIYNSAIDITISCDTPDAVIYYTLDGTIPMLDGKTTYLYDGKPIHLEKSQRIYAVAYGKNSCRSSIATFASLIAPTPPESDFTVSASGELLSYSGSLTSLSVPDKINGITVTAIAEGVFSQSTLSEIILPDTVTEIGKSAFEGCESLIYFLSRNACKIGENAFKNCKNLSYIVLGKLTEIGSYAFCSTASECYFLREASFKLDLSGLATIPEGAFMNSGISSASFGYVDAVGDKAFRGCDALVGVNFTYLGYMPYGAFKGCLSLSEVYIGGLTYLANGAFSSCTALEHVVLPKVEFVDSNAFENCKSLSEVELPAAQTVYSNAFNGCLSLRELNLPAMTSFEAELYFSDTNFPRFPSSLRTFIAPSLKKTVRDMFKTAYDVSVVSINSADTIVPYTFRSCRNMYLLEINGVVTLEENALSDCVIRFVDAPNLVSAKNLPSNSGILLSNNFVEAYETAKNLTVYGTKGTFVERYAEYKGYDFVPIPFIYNELPEYITENSERVGISAIGFELQYQWYWNTEPSTESGTPIDGATDSAYTFTSSDTAPYYYCVITQNDLGVITEITTNIIIKDTTPADYTAYDEAVALAGKVNRSEYSNIELLDAALAVNVSGKYSCEQSQIDAQTKAILDAISALKLKKAETITLTASKTELGLLEKQKIVIAIKPIEAKYGKIVWLSSNEDVLTVTKNGTVMCVGDGEAVITATVTNNDGTVTKNTITFDCDLTFFEKIFSLFVRAYIHIAKAFDEIQRSASL